MSKRKFKEKEKKKSRQKIIAAGVVILIIIAAVILLSRKGNTQAGGVNTNIGMATINFTKNGELTFLDNRNNFLAKIDIEIADTEEKRTQGLMFRASMKENQGMLFIFDREEMQAFWMKNTMIPLDMIFVNAKKEIVNIRRNARPYDLSSYTSLAPTKYVVEVNGGYCKRHGIKSGDRITFRIY